MSGALKKSLRRWPVKSTGMEMTRLLLLFPLLALPIAVYQLDKLAVERGGEALLGSTLQLVVYGACAIALPLILWWAWPHEPELTSDGACLAWRKGRDWKRWPLHELRYGLGRWQMARVGMVGSILHIEWRGEQLSVGAHKAFFDDPAVYQVGNADSDLALLKPCGEWWLTGTLQREEPARELACRARVGELETRFSVIGDRWWEPAGGMSAPNAPGPGDETYESVSGGGAEERRQTAPEPLPSGRSRSARSTASA